MFRFIAEELAAGKRLVVATVVFRTGSGPRDPGAMMVVAENGRVCGTVGGGLLEAQTLEAAKSVWRNGRARLLPFDLNARDLYDSAMVCGGRVEILVDVLSGGNPDHVRIFKKLAEALHSGIGVYLVTSILEGAGQEVHAGRGLLIGNDFDCADLSEPFRDAAQLKQQAESNVVVLLHQGMARCLIQPVIPPGRVFIIGAGHVGQALAAVCAIAGLQTVVIDARPEFACRNRFPDAAEIKCIASYAEALKNSGIGNSDAIVIATHSHLSDRDVLAAALMTQARYIGMIASRRKRDIIYESLGQQGFAKEDFARVHSPVGLDIGAQTPAEIAVSIAAELIAVRNQKG